MIIQNFATAQILFLLVSDDRIQEHELARDLQRSKFRYAFVCLAGRSNLVETARQKISDNDGKLPVVLVINYKFAGKTCKDLLELARTASRITAIECVVTHPPIAERLRETLLDLGARLFDGEPGMALTQLTLH